MPGIFISRLVPGGIAEGTGLLAVNDEVLEVNGIEVAGKTLDQVTDMMIANSTNMIVTVKPANQSNNVRRVADPRLPVVAMPTAVVAVPTDADSKVDVSSDDDEDEVKEHVGGHSVAAFATSAAVPPDSVSVTTATAANTDAHSVAPSILDTSVSIVPDSGIVLDDENTDKADTESEESDDDDDDDVVIVNKQLAAADSETPAPAASSAVGTIGEHVKVIFTPIEDL